MELTIDGKVCDLGSIRIAVPGYDAARLSDPEACRTGRRLECRIPATPRNDRLLGSPLDPHAAVRFNDEPHEAAVTAQGAVLLTGRVRLLSSSEEEYTIEIRDGGAGWAENTARRMFNTLGIDYAGHLTPTEICAGWRDASPVKFFPIHRDEYPRRNGSSDLMPAERILSPDDYHPFLRIAPLVERMFHEAGYALRSRFFESDFFRSLYMSGAYASHDTTAAAGRMGFQARRRGDTQAEANEAGKVDANPASVLHSVGNIVDTATPQSPDAEGKPIDGLYNNGGCFGTDDDGRIRFSPPTETTVGFEFFLRYTTGHRIASRTRLEGFDTIYLGPGSEVAFTLANRYEDRRGAVTPGYAYRAVVFDHREGAQYRLTGRIDGTPDTVWGTFDTRSAAVTAPPGDFADERLEVLGSDGWKPYDGDWALYAGYIGEEGETTVEIRVRTASERVSPAQPRYFDQIYFAGAAPGTPITVHRECSLRPLFLPGPGFGSSLSFTDVAQVEIRQIELLEALAHLFNLRFYSEEGRKVVWVEPEEEFLGAGPEADWSDRTDFSQPVEMEDLALELHEERTWCYREGDGAVRRADAETGETLGSWSVRIDSQAALVGPETRRNPLFAPLALLGGALPQRPLGADPSGRRPRRCRTGAGGHTPHRALRRDAPPARRRAVGVPLGRGGLSACGLPLRRRQRRGALHTRFRGPRRSPGTAPLLRPPDPEGGHPGAHLARAADRPRRIRRAARPRLRSPGYPLRIPHRHGPRDRPRHAPQHRGVRSRGRLGPLHVRPTLRRVSRRSTHNHSTRKKMTRIEERMIRAASDRVRGMTAVEAVEVLFREGLLSPRRCEQAAIRDEIARLERSGIPRCEAFHAAAEAFACSYEKARYAFYETFKR